eukprot:3607060-Lingulodinium_polyedra.AAC.1
MAATSSCTHAARSQPLHIPRHHVEATAGVDTVPRAARLELVAELSLCFRCSSMKCFQVQPHLLRLVRLPLPACGALRRGSQRAPARQGVDA